MKDNCGNGILVGDLVAVTSLNSDRGAILSLTGAPGRVVGFGRTRVIIDFVMRVGLDRVGSEYLHITEAVDGRLLRTWADVYETGRGSNDHAAWTAAPPAAADLEWALAEAAVRVTRYPFLLKTPG